MTPRPQRRADGFPTRNDIELMSDAEKKITEAMGAVESSGCSISLTEAVILLSKARNCVADHMEGVGDDD